MPKVPKIIVSLRSVFIIIGWYFSMQNHKSENKYSSLFCFFLFIKSIRRRRASILGTLVQFRHFRHFLC